MLSTSKGGFTYSFSNWMPFVSLSSLARAVQCFIAVVKAPLCLVPDLRGTSVIAVMFTVVFS